MKKILWSTKKDSKIALFRGEDGDLYVGYEGGIPQNTRSLLNAFYRHIKMSGEVEKMSYLLSKAEQKWLRKHRELIESWGYKLPNP